MLPAKIEIETVTIICPYCGDIINDPENGSEFWTRYQVDVFRNKKPAIFHMQCGKYVKLPKIS